MDLSFRDCFHFTNVLTEFMYTSPYECVLMNTVQELYTYMTWLRAFRYNAKVSMDRLGPPTYLQQTKEAIDESVRFVDDVKGVNGVTKE